MKEALMTFRQIAIRILSKINPGDITIRHHYTRDKLVIHSFRHKGYWWHGRRREKASMTLLKKLIPAESTVVEVGAHIGYVSLFLKRVVGDSGKLFVFEPSDENFAYLRRNTAGLPGIRVIQAAVSDKSGRQALYVENYSGQNCSLVEDFNILEDNIASSGLSNVRKRIIEVDTVSLDDFLDSCSAPAPSFVKVDAEGSELEVLRGLSRRLGQPGMALMVEVTRRHEEVFALLLTAGYALYDDCGNACETIEDFFTVGMNVFCIPRDDWREDVFAKIRRAA